MDELKKTRWKQRFENFTKSYKLLEKYVDQETTTEIERAGGIQFFEMCFELAWKTMKDYLETEGYQTKTPRETIKQAFEIDLINDTDVYIWLAGIEDRNLTVHTYDEQNAKEVENLIKNKYFPIFRKLYETLARKI